ncbi:hypothetical protein G6F63_016615 [Rhizopus arrhizus]|nr:hypothetical protein G6F63_016615 [Rhizopus arrhizus]
MTRNTVSPDRRASFCAKGRSASSKGPVPPGLVVAFGELFFQQAAQQPVRGRPFQAGGTHHALQVDAVFLVLSQHAQQPKRAAHALRAVGGS